MTILNFTGFEQGTVLSSQGSDDYQVFANFGGSVQSTIKKNGSYAAEFDKVTNNIPSLVLAPYAADGRINTNSGSYGTIYFTGYFRYASKPASGDEFILTIVPSGGGTEIAGITLASDGKLKIYDTGNGNGNEVLLGTSTTALSQDVWYRIGIKIIAGASGSYEVKIDGTSEISGSRTWNITSNIGYTKVGNSYDKGSQSFKFYWDDIVLDDSAYIDVDYAVGILKPNANGSTMSWANGTGASDYTQVDEIPIDITDYVQSPTSGNPNIALFNFQSRSDAGINNGTIYAVKAVAIHRENSTVSSATLIRVRSGSTNSDSGTLNGTTSTQGRSSILVNNPATGSAWSNSAIDAIEAGLVENNAVAVRGISVMVYVLYAQATTPTNTNFLLMF